ncbi:hypothetical protein DTO271G3_5752 [Paecilomyces variotii]|nr:hypothetical protein DTO271G3_5752 [Paecilomyces variotii]
MAFGAGSGAVIPPSLDPAPGTLQFEQPSRRKRELIRSAVEGFHSVLSNLFAPLPLSSPLYCWVPTRSLRPRFEGCLQRLLARTLYNLNVAHPDANRELPWRVLGDDPVQSQRRVLGVGSIQHRSGTGRPNQVDVRFFLSTTPQLDGIRNHLAADAPQDTPRLPLRLLEAFSGVYARNCLQDRVHLRTTRGPKPLVDSLLSIAKKSSALSSVRAVFVPLHS